MSLTRNRIVRPLRWTGATTFPTIVISPVRPFSWLGRSCGVPPAIEV